ncbi:trace amine-associated receptor 13c-like protein [Lates japonicus]|uniref:Trace amine-associated receptor 13c-like protein n=1 Tax=Lates japonicus TaxID=270547 RepID=A0AAD3QYN2_LATJO|nr:trace amine-associated receptor 13c-like protein [Lates japonicus]
MARDKRGRGREGIREDDTNEEDKESLLATSVREVARLSSSAQIWAVTSSHDGGDTEEDDSCFAPLNSSCTLMHGTPEVMLIKTLLYCIALFTVMLNLLVIISISHFRHRHFS